MESNDQPSNQPIESMKIAEGSLQGRVSCLNNPVVNAMVTVGTLSTLTDSMGNFSIEHIPPGISLVKVRKSSSRFYNYSERMIVEAGSQKNLLISLEPNGSVKGTVTDENGKPLSSVEVSGQFKLSQDALTCRTEERGSFSFADVPQGDYYVKAIKLGFVTTGKTISVVSAKTTICDFVLIPSNASIIGKVVMASGSQVDCEVILSLRGVVVAKSRLFNDSDGKYVFKELARDIYEIRASYLGGPEQVRRVKLDKDEIVNFELEAQNHSSQ